MKIKKTKNNNTSPHTHTPHTPFVSSHFSSIAQKVGRRGQTEAAATSNTKQQQQQQQNKTKQQQQQ